MNPKVGIRLTGIKVRKGDNVRKLLRGIRLEKKLRTIDIAGFTSADVSAFENNPSDAVGVGVVISHMKNYGLKKLIICPDRVGGKEIITDVNSLADNLFNARKNLGLTRNDIKTVNQGTVQNMENKTKALSTLDRYINLGQAVGISKLTINI